MINWEELKVGDKVKVMYSKGQTARGTIEGTITKLWVGGKWKGNHQGQVDDGWCFHSHDKLVYHIPT